MPARHDAYSEKSSCIYRGQERILVADVLAGYLFQFFAKTHVSEEPYGTLANISAVLPTPTLLTCLARVPPALFLSIAVDRPTHRCAFTSRAYLDGWVCRALRQAAESTQTPGGY
jgi:hypothetical protein